MAFPSDQDALLATQRCLWLEHPENAKMVYIANTLEISKLAISESLLPSVRNQPGVEILSELQELSFDDEGNINIHFLN